MTELFVLVVLVALCLVPVWLYELNTKRRPAGGILAALVVAGSLFTFWMAGVFDEQLYKIGLNRQECARNLITGAVFCGDELDQLRHRLEDFERGLE